MELIPAAGDDDPFNAGSNDDAPFVEVGDFSQGSPISRWALARYLVGRAIAESVTRSLLVLGVVLLGLTVVCEWVAHVTFWAVVLGIVALGVFATRAMLRAIIERLIAADRVGPLEPRLRALVAETRPDVLAELRRIGLPGHTWTLPWFAVLFARRRHRQQTVARLRNFDVDRAVSRARVDELHLLLRDAAGGPDRLSW